MAGSKTDALEQRLLDHIFKGGASPSLTTLSTVYVALYSAGPSDSSAGTEITGSSYVRVAVASTGWTRTGSQIVNTADVTFPNVTSVGYTVTGWAVLDASTGGNQLYWGDVTPSVTMNVGDPPHFVAGTLVINED